MFLIKDVKHKNKDLLELSTGLLIQITVQEMTGYYAFLQH